MVPHLWQEWRSRLRLLAMAGLAEADDAYDVDRYQAVLQLAAALEPPEKCATGATPAPRRLVPWPETPKVDVRGVVFQDEALLFVKERIDGCWTFPGGWADVGISPSENVEREIREEAGYETRAVRLLAVYDRQRHPHVPPHPFHIYKLFFQCELIGGQAATSVETDDVAFFREDEIPNLSRGRVTPEQVHRMFQLCREPDAPADYD